ncbi:MAG TPA: hypothetical protein VLW17_01545 [Thermoanaerobaculaceae bacterium]|nr:hypothetical protein [Thermoanaerobaculaceae bacterium]
MSDPELEFYRAVEDHFAALRGTPFLFTPKDFALLRKWWREGVPLAAVLAGLGEVFERRRERDGDPVSSLSYCRHAVARHAKRLASAHTGSPGEPAPRLDVGRALASLAAQLDAPLARWQGVAGVGAVLADVRAAVAGLPADADPAAVEETLAELEFTCLEAVLAVLPPAARAEVDAEVERELAGARIAEEARARTHRALQLKAVRRVVGLPRLELPADAA